jgi:hypothetical protein
MWIDALRRVCHIPGHATNAQGEIFEYHVVIHIDEAVKEI